MESPKLIVAPEGKPAWAIQLGDQLSIGRSPGNQLVLEDQKASRKHAEIRCLGTGRYLLSDLGSANGTWLNGRRLTSPRELQDGDQILIGSVSLRFFSPSPQVEEPPGVCSGTLLYMRNEQVIVLVADIRNFTGMSETLPNCEFSRFISRWFREASDIVEKNGGTIDKFIGDAIMAYWVIATPADPSTEIRAALRTSRELISLAALFSERLSADFPGHTFHIGVGMNMGTAMLGNVGTGENQAFTIVGDSVNVAFRLEALTKEKGSPVVVSGNMAMIGCTEFRFRDLGPTEVKGRKDPISIWALDP